MGRARSAAGRLVGRGSTLVEVVAAAEGVIGVPIRIRHCDDLHGPSAVVTVVPGQLALVSVDQRVDASRFEHVVAHELGHLVLGHGSGERRHYDNQLERDAELFGTEVVRRMRMAPLSVQSRAVR